MRPDNIRAQEFITKKKNPYISCKAITALKQTKLTLAIFTCQTISNVSGWQSQNSYKDALPTWWLQLCNYFKTTSHPPVVQYQLLYRQLVKYNSVCTPLYIFW